MDLNKAIESLEDTLFRESLNESNLLSSDYNSSELSSKKNDLSKELPIGNSPTKG